MSADPPSGHARPPLAPGSAPAVEPARLDWRDGLPASDRYGDLYASRDGAWAQANHVFLAGNGLPQRWRGCGQFVILETGFGLGTNFLATWHAWEADPRRCAVLHFVSCERHPLGAAELLSAAALNPPLGELAGQLAAAWPMALPGLHRLEFSQGRVRLTLAFGDVRRLLPELVLGADALFLDGFAPDRNPAMWQPEVFKAMARLARPGCTLATWSTAGQVQRDLQAAGFLVERRPGFGSKREMLAGEYAPRWRVRRHDPPAARWPGPARGVPANPTGPPGGPHALVVGAGLAGSATAWALARRGWRVQVLERGSTAAAGASALPAGLLHPHLSDDDNLASRLSRAGFLFAVQALRRLDPDGRTLWQETGVFQVDSARPGGHRDDRPAHPGAAGIQALLARRLDAQAAAAVLGRIPGRSGLWFDRALVVSPARWCAAMLDHPGIEVNYGTEGVTVESVGGGWRAATRDGRSFTAPVLVLANALEAGSLVPDGLPEAGLHPVHGQVSLLARGALAGLGAGIAGDGYVIPALPVLGSPALVGGTYEPRPAGAPEAWLPMDEGAAHAGNLTRLRRLLAGNEPGGAPRGIFGGVRCVSRDRLPLAGAVPDPAAVEPRNFFLDGARAAALPRRAGLWLLTGLGSRGLSLACLCAETLAAGIEGEPLPLESSLLAAIDPARFLARRLRHADKPGVPT